MLANARLRKSFALASAVAIAMCAVAIDSHADLVGLHTDLHATVLSPTGPLRVYRIYAVFSNANDRVTSWGGPFGPSNGPAEIKTMSCIGLPTTLAFFNSVPAAPAAPSQAAIDDSPQRQWDTFPTIGVSIAEQGSGTPPIPDLTQLTVGFPTFINGTIWSQSQHIAYILRSPEQSRAGYAADGDAPLRVLLMQLTVPDGAFPFVSVRVSYRLANSANGSGDLSNQTLGSDGVCCLRSGACVSTSQGECLGGLNGVFHDCGGCEACEQPCKADIAPAGGDGAVNVSDLLAVISGWGPCPQWSPTCPGNVVRNGESTWAVNVTDLLAVIEDWGDCD